MGVGWRNLEMPKKLGLDESTYTETYGKFYAEPFERGYATTIGNSLRRILISSIEGSAVTSMKIEGAQHEFASLPGVQEDMAEIVINIKRLVLKAHFKSPKKVYIKVDKKGAVTAGDIITDDTIEIMNPDLHIATLTKKTKLNIEMEVGKGRGYVPAERNKKEGQHIGIIPVDSLFSPVKKVCYHVENTRVGQITDYDKLIIEVWTNGSINPKDAMLYGSHILQRHLDIFVGFGKLPEEEDVVEETSEDKELYKKMSQPVSELELSVRSANCLKEARIKTIGDLVKKSEMEMLKYRNFGKKSLGEMNKILQEMGLSFGMKFDKDKLREYIKSRSEGE
ncbi:MAG: DNA-directed RNA polymerase subunit alpha [Candidatus Omnitrophica bacterium]|nr:DNA-directed RNA polymerase subunit alpha [Candidatus Omnitrophota bacterium]